MSPASAIYRCHFFIVISLFFWLPVAIANSPVWQVEKDGHVVYLVGTIHLLTDDDYPLPKGFEVAYRASEQVVFETDVAAMKSPETVSKLKAAMTFVDGKTIRSVVSPATYQRLLNYMQAEGLPIDILSHLKIGGLLLSLPVLKMQKMGYTAAAGIDQHFHQKAQQQGKSITWLESPEEQIALINRLGAGRSADILINEVLDGIKDIPAFVAKLKQVWKTGDIAGIEAIMYKNFKKYPQAADILVTQRNQHWLPTIKKMLNSNKITAVFVGFGHLVGDQGLVALLKKDDYAVTQLP